MHIRYAALTDIGFQRKRNEDSYVIEKRALRGLFGRNHEIYLFGIADGMGGHACGDIASEMACEEVAGFIDESLQICPPVIIRRLKEKFLHIDHLLRIYATVETGCADMGTTLSAMVILKNKGIVAHVGDCRILRLRQGELSRLTTDHRFVQEMIEEGLINEKAASSHPFRNKLTHVIGTSAPLEYVETGLIKLLQGDRYILSTDGLHDGLTQGEIKRILADSLTPETAAERLLSQGLQRGSKDNMTVIVTFLD